LVTFPRKISGINARPSTERNLFSGLRYSPYSVYSGHLSGEFLPSKVEKNIFLTKWRCCLETDSCWSKELCIRCKSQDRTNTFAATTDDIMAMRPFANLIWTLVAFCFHLLHGPNNTRIITVTKPHRSNS